MPTYKVTYEDGRNLRVLADDEVSAKKHANKAETTRLTLMIRKGFSPDPPLSYAVDAVEVFKGKDY